MTQNPRPAGFTQDGAPVMQPVSSVEIEIPTDPKKEFGCTIKVYGTDGQADYDLAFKLAAEFVAKRGRLKAGILAADGSEGETAAQPARFPV